ncbi:uncharacterized protein LOC112559049 isoform X2 [Pomacea canaliculata]|uniref:uncharacterized protein LOC112559049 isoform X2 n=1 Tax=Pomacea canaliculata TaxID=400727 RepID=UPI000D73D3CC|nr:uncharacterized protein LOC112559049 isoform X2 [Pomacea canaliculata]XP_025085688.1 uncharacterized protein LOC112559049 isoform X2 [Pomacea canaliculata]XP_025085689.1 uncharacterized protein LOC112559049 isoform X2 [Pomacea canaliculata]XP_025085690.1 uncharacterized protein LOC112559049 isoform X2 [Pomacea canaliculata]
MMKISVFLLLVFTEMVLCYTTTSTCESFRWLDSKGKGSCDFKTDFCGWTNNYNWKIGWCYTHNRKCCFVEMKNNEKRQHLMSPQLCGIEDVHYTMKLRYEIPNPNMYTLYVHLMTDQGWTLLWQTDNKLDVLTEELNFTLPQLPFQIIIEGEKKADRWDGDQNILILDVSFHQTNIPSEIERKSTTPTPVVTEAMISDNGNGYHTSDILMTTTTTSMTMDFTSLSTSLTQGLLTVNTISATTLSQSITTALISNNTSIQNERQPGDAIESVIQDTPTTSDTQSANSTSDPTTVAAAVAGAVIAVLISVVIAAVLIRRKTKKTRNSQCDRLPTVNPCLLPVNTARGHVIPSVAAGSDPDHYDCVQDAPRGKPRGAAGGTGSSTLAADIYNHTHDSDNKQLGRHGDGGGGIYSTLATDDTYSHLQGKEHHRFDRQGGNKNSHSATVSDDDYHHL